MALRKKVSKLGDCFLEHRRTKPTFLDKVNDLIDWRPVNAFLKKKTKRKANAVGNPAYPPLVMFKILLLQRWCNLSDPGVEQALLDHLPSPFSLQPACPGCLP